MLKPSAAEKVQLSEQIIEKMPSISMFTFRTATRPAARLSIPAVPAVNIPPNISSTITSRKTVRSVNSTIQLKTIPCGLDTATVAISGSKTDAGEYKELLVPNVTKIVDAKGRDVTSYYDISYEDGTLTISPRRPAERSRDQKCKRRQQGLRRHTPDQAPRSPLLATASLTARARPTT